MATITKFDIFKFDGKISFNIWKVQMMIILIQNGLKKAFGGKAKKLVTRDGSESWAQSRPIKTNPN